MRRKLLYPVPIISNVFSNADDSLFKTILKNSCHVLYLYLPESQYQHYHVGQSPYNKALMPKTAFIVFYFVDF